MTSDRESEPEETISSSHSTSSSSLRRQRTASENENVYDSDDNESMNVNSQRARESPSHEEDNSNEDINEAINENINENSSDDTSDDTSTSDDSTDESNEDYYSDEEDEEGDNAMDLMNQLQTALFGAAGANGTITSAELERLRQSITRVNHTGIFSRGGATHSNQIREIIRSLPTETDPKLADPTLLYSAFMELWELIVLTGEEVEAYEFDSVVDLKPLIGHLLRVLKWEEECQVYGSDFLLFAVRCTRAAIQYSPTAARKLVEKGLIPLLSKQLFSVEYIDLAEDLIQIIQLLTKPSTNNTPSQYSLACLQSDGIKAVLGFVDFFALSVQIISFTAAAQMATALTDENFNLFLSNELVSLLHSSTRKNPSDSLNQKLIHWALRTILNALVAAPKHSNTLCPITFVLEDLIPLASFLPLDVGSIVLQLLNNSFNDDFIVKKTLLNQCSSTEKLIETMLSASVTDESLLETTLQIIIELFCKRNNQSTNSKRQELLFDLLNYCSKIKNVTNASVNNSFPVPVELLKSVTQSLFNFYLNSPSIAQSSRHLILCTLLLLDESAKKGATVDLCKMSTVSQLITSDDAIVKIIGLEWCEVLSSAAPSDFILTAKRQGLSNEFKSSSSNLKLSQELKKWLSDRLESLLITVFSGEENKVFDLYTSKMIEDLMKITIETNHNIQIEEEVISPFKSIDQLIEMIRSGTISTFTEFEWLGNPENCLAGKLLDFLKSESNSEALKALTLSDSSVTLEPLCQAIYKALNRYDSDHFKVSVPLARATLSNPFESLAILARPIRVNVKFGDTTDPQQQQQKLMICDPFANISWLVKMATCCERERRVILRETEIDLGRNFVNDQNSVESSIDRVFDTLNPDTLNDTFGLVNFSSTAFKNINKRAFLILTRQGQNQSQRIPLEPSQSLIEVLFSNLIGGGNTVNEENWKRINELRSASITIVIEDVNGSRDDNEMEMEIVTMENEFKDLRIKLALDLLSKIPFKISNDQLSSKLLKELNSPLLIAINGISSHWITAARLYPFLFPFYLRVSLMKSTCLGRLRGLWILQQRLSSSTDVSSISLPRRKFRIHRSHILPAIRKVFSSSNSGDLRLFEFEYADELGTGHGPTMEFYALASKEFIRPSLELFHVTNLDNLKTDQFIQPEGEGLFPSWTHNRCLDNNDFQLLGSFVARAWLDDRIIDIPLHPLMISMLKGEINHLVLEDINRIDPELWKVLVGNDLKGSDVNFLVPGSEIPLCPHGQVRIIMTDSDVEEFKISLLGHINNCLNFACKSFLKGFNDSFPHSFSEVTSFFPISDLMSLFSSSQGCNHHHDWSVQNILSALVSDHGYHCDSPQIQWLAEILSETAQSDQLNGQRNRVKMIQFLTGAAYLPIGGWKALKPSLTIVCKTFNTTPPVNTLNEINNVTAINENNNITNNNNNNNTHNNTNNNTNNNNTNNTNNTRNNTIISPISNTSSITENHDIYLPSVMTCANYLKLPRYSSKEIMRERFIYAITEGFGSFHLS